MAEEQKNIVISKNNSGFPDYLDFDTLRREGIDYLGKLGGKIWTDHNVHDPGITILEILCYALLDLGYRTNLPAEDIFSRNPGDTSADNNFFTPAQILACNPLTITDFRKLLIDIDGVKNAWLEVATDQKDFCRPRPGDDPVIGANLQNKNNCIDFLNGLYHVYIDLEINVEIDYKDDADGKEKYLKNIEGKIKEALMAHRNLCEDFIDIYFLCKQETGVCADIELEDGTDAEQVYIALVEKLRNFFSPSPQFYTLQQLLDKEKPIDEIFAGQPYNITESHGFVDTEEFEQLKLRKEIHLSDVYNAMFEVAGVKAVRRLNLQICKNDIVTTVNGWKYNIPQNHVPEFSVACSGFQFTRQGMSVPVDFKKFEGLFAVNFTQNGKILYPVPSPYLDTEMPKGIYRSDLGEYYSVQNEFPRVYGIAEGGLPDNASDIRKSQAYQLKGYLLFFDQLLANYAAQLKQIRSLFSLNAAGNEEDNHTYFINQLSTVPDLQKLLRFNSNETNSNSLGVEGSLQLVPVEKKKLLELKEQDKLKKMEIEGPRPNGASPKIIYLEPYIFSTLAEQDTAISQVKNDLYFEQYQCEYVTKSDGCVYYYILTCSDEIALICKKYFKDVTEATGHSTSVKYIGVFDENYRSFTTAANNFSFDIELSLLSFAKYLQLLVEDKALFYQRRQDFLNHLLARFAEKFTDYAQLSFGIYSNNGAENKEIKNKEHFLSNYGDLSSNRGKAYDYLANNWNNDNVSGFEKKFKSLSGIENWKRRSLCNFEVAEYENQFEVVLIIAGTPYFTANENFDSREVALFAAKGLFLAMQDIKNYKPVFILHDNAYKLTLKYGLNNTAVTPLQYTSSDAAMSVAGNLIGLFTEKKPEDTVFESGYGYVPQLNNWEGNMIRISTGFFETGDWAVKEALKGANKIDDRKQWEYDKDGAPLGSLYYDAKNKEVLTFINTDAFKIDIANTIVGKPDKFSYNLLDKENNFKFQSVSEFGKAQDAQTDANELLTLMVDEKNYEIFKDEEKAQFLIRIIYSGKPLAICFIKNNTGEDALKLQRQIIDIVNKHKYFIAINKVPHRWKFNYLLGYEKDNKHVFHSVQEYPDPAEALSASTLFYNALSTLRADLIENELFLTPASKDAISAVKLIPGETQTDLKAIKPAVEKLLEEQKEIKRLSANPNPEVFSNSVDIDPASKLGLYVYRLIDKDNVPAFYTNKFANKDIAKAAIKKLATQFTNGQGYLQICMGGDIINKRKDDITKTNWYHYQVKCINQFYPSGLLAGKPLILFESTKGYQSIEDAEKAFTENYLSIIHLASDAANYGKEISLAEVLVHAEDDCIKNDSIVFVPKQTYEALGAADAVVIDRIIKFALSFPIRIVQYKSKEFYDFFPCEKEDIDDTGNKNCKKQEEIYIYYFNLLSPAGDGQWQSVKFYDNPEEAKKDFDFFLMLLWYPGNYYTDCDDCEENSTQYKIYIREVLAESAERFTTEEQAWGNEGVQKLICVSQTENAFHTYIRTKDCCHSFYTACGNGLVVHPCKYDTPQRRDKVLLNLYQAFQKYATNKSWQTDYGENGILLRNEKGDFFARIDLRGQDQFCISDRVAELIPYISLDDKYKEDGNGRIVLQKDNGEILVSSQGEGFTLSDWKRMLQAFICYYPIIKMKDEKSGNDTYCIEIKLPGFNTCAEDMQEEKPCGCGDEPATVTPDCYIAWKADCCYGTCAEAEQALQIIFLLLINYTYYQPVFDCVCNSYGITIQFGSIAELRRGSTAGPQASEIVAVNPQCYPGPEAACEAVSRAKQLIDCEGLHLVEHILLRPHCNPDDCRCKQYINQCDDETGCQFIWPVQDEDPCTEEKDICFVPGADRYSFIATIALPAWPARFRDQGKRQLLENILYREAPAHVLLRILWLAPHDFCCFESKFKNWNRWLAGKKTCTGDFSVCDFMQFLFDRYYECLDDCTVCLPCKGNVVVPLPCFADMDTIQKENIFLSQVNDLYCWRQQYCGEYQYIDCEKKEQIPGIEINTAVSVNEKTTVAAKILTDKKPITKPSSPAKTEKVKKKTRAQISKTAADKNKIKEMVVPSAVTNTPLSPSKEKIRIVNSRMSKYRNSVAEILEKAKGNLVAAQVQSFLADTQPAYERLSKLATEILQNKAPKTKAGKKLAKKQVNDLLQNSICYYLDKLFFNGKDMNRVAELKKIFDKMHKAKINIKDMYEYWDLPEIKKQEPDIKEEEIKDLFGVDKK